MAETSISCPATKDWVPHAATAGKASVLPAVSAPSFAFSAKGGISRSYGEEPRVKSNGIQPFGNSAKDGAPDPLWRGKKYDSPCVDALSARTYNHCWPCAYLGPCLFFAFAARCAGQVTAMQMRLRETR